MKYSTFLFCIALNFCNGILAAQTSDCNGRRRWDIKTLTDKQTKKINFSPSDTTIAYLISITPAQQIKRDTPRFGVEYRTFRVRCRIKESMRKSDGDYHLVMTDADDTTKIMIGEIPDPDCGVAKKSGYVLTFVALRNYMDSLKNSGSIPSGTFAITGVAFFDKVHEKFEVASNGIELHPILSIVKE